MIFLDINILLEFWFNRDKKQKVLEIFKEKEKLCISFLTVHLFYHFGIKNEDELETLDNFIKNFRILESGSESYQTAKKIRVASDFEDALQIATALENNVEKVLTLDQKMAKRYGKLIKIEVL